MMKDFDWDESILFAARERWNDAPTSLFWNGPVVKIISGLDSALNHAPQ
jgi:hypothetical protein